MNTVLSFVPKRLCELSWTKQQLSELLAAIDSFGLDEEAAKQTAVNLLMKFDQPEA